MQITLVCGEKQNTWRGKVMSDNTRVEKMGPNVNKKHKKRKKAYI